MLTDEERAELHLRLQEIEADAELAAALAASRLATALHQPRERHDEPPLRMR